MSNKTIALDIDGPIAASDIAWLSNLESMTGIKLGAQPTDYNLAKYFKEELAYEGLDGFEFWKSEDPYRNVKPVEGSVRACEKLSKAGYRLLPVTKIYTEHGCSKRKWLNKYFPMLDSPIYISIDGYKSDVSCSVIIDDRLDNFKGFTKPTRGVLFNTPYRNTLTDGIDIGWDVCDNWEQIIELLLGDK